METEKEKEILQERVNAMEEKMQQILKFVNLTQNKVEMLA